MSDCYLSTSRQSTVPGPESRPQITWQLYFAWSAQNCLKVWVHTSGRRQRTKRRGSSNMEKEGERSGVGEALGPFQDAEGEKGQPLPPARGPYPQDGPGQDLAATRPSHSFSADNVQSWLPIAQLSPSRGKFLSVSGSGPPSLGVSAEVMDGVIIPYLFLQCLQPPRLLHHHYGATGSASPPGWPPALWPPGEKPHPSSLTLMKSSFCSEPEWARGQYSYPLGSALHSGSVITPHTSLQTGPSSAFLHLHLLES